MLLQLLEGCGLKDLAIEVRKHFVDKQAPTLQSLQQMSPKPSASLQDSSQDVVVTCVQHFAKIANNTREDRGLFVRYSLFIIYCIIGIYIC